MKRFTATEKWSKSWFQDIGLLEKCFWMFLCDNCDPAGVWDTNWKLAKFTIGSDVNESHMAAFGDRVRRLPNGKWLLTGFVEFQYGTLSPDCRPHQKVIDLLKKHGLTTTLQDIPETLPCRVFNTLQEEEEDKDKEEDKEKEEGESEGKPDHAPDAMPEAEANRYPEPFPPATPPEKRPPPPPNRADWSRAIEKARIVLAWINDLSGRRYPEAGKTIETIAYRLIDVGLDIDGVKAMLTRQWDAWKLTRFAEHFTVSTLFSPDKFPDYYARRAQAPATDQRQELSLKEQLAILEEAEKTHPANRDYSGCKLDRVQQEEAKRLVSDLQELRRRIKLVRSQLLASIKKL